MGARVIWMPTLSSWKERKNKGFDDGISLLGQDGEVLPVLRETLALIRDHDLVLCTGHILEEETTKLLHEALRTGVTKYVITHPSSGGDFIGSPFQKAGRQGVHRALFRGDVPLWKMNPFQIVEAMIRRG
jgi:hypothetical protein